MPRKPGLGPHIKRIELMSTGHEYRPSAGADDFTGQPIALAADTSPVRHLASGQELRDEANREKRRLQGAMLAGVGITRDGYQPMIKPKPPFKPFRRRF